MHTTCAVPPLEFIEETVILGEDLIKPDNNIELTQTNSESPQFLNTDETPIEPLTTEGVEVEKVKPVTADDIKLYLLVQRLLNETPLIDGYVKKMIKLFCLLSICFHIFLHETL